MEQRVNFTFELNKEQQQLALALMASGNYRPREVAFSIKSVEGEGFNCTLYKKETHGRRKFCVQGSKAQDFVEFVLQPNGVIPVTMGGGLLGAPSSEAASLPHGGSDESGKGDYFGPLVVACCYVDEELADKLRNLKVEWYDSNNVKHVDVAGVRDCKLIANNVVLMRMGKMIRGILGQDRFNVVKIGPTAYNRLYAKIKNVNRILAWAHGTCIEGLLECQPDCPRVVVDQFARTESTVKFALKDLGKKVVLEQRHKAESYAIGVAAASVLARESFLRALSDMGAEMFPGTEPSVGAVPMGSSDPRVRHLAASMVRQYGPGWLMSHCKTHFQTTDKVLAACGRSRTDLPPEGQVTSMALNGEFWHG